MLLINFKADENTINIKLLAYQVACIELQAAKRTVQCLTRFAVSCYWENLSTRIQQCADCGDLHGLYSGIREAIGPIPKKLSPLLAADGALLVDTSAQLECWVDHCTPWAQLGGGHGGRVPLTFSDSGDIICHVPSHFSL